MFVFDPKTEKVTKTLDVSCSNMTLSGDSLFVYSTEWSYLTGENTISYTVIDTKTQKVIDRDFIKDGTAKDIKIPYGIATNRERGEFYVTDAKNYVTPGRLHCYASRPVHASGPSRRVTSLHTSPSHTSNFNPKTPIAMKPIHSWSSS